MAEWLQSALEDVANFASGHRNSQDAVADGAYPFFTCSTEVLRHSDFDFDTEAVIMAGNNADARFHLQYFKGRFAARQRTYIITPKDSSVDARFLYYALHGLQPLFSAQAQGTTTKFVTIGILRNAPIRLPPIEEQRSIAHMLGTLDDKIELNRRMNETLEAMAQALFKSWFVDFDPVRAKAEGRDPGLRKPLADLFPNSFEDSEVGEIPTGWRMTTLAEVSALNPEVWSKQTYPNEIRYVDLANTKWGRIEAVAIHRAADAPSRAQRVLRRGDTIVGTVRPGNGSYALIAEDGLTGSTGFAVLRPRSPHYAEFVYLAATSAENIDALAHLADGGAYPAIRPEVVSATSIVLPDEQILRGFSSVAAPLFSRIARNEEESRTLTALRDALLPKLVSGELRISPRVAAAIPV